MMRLMIVDDHEVVRAGLRLLLDAESDIDVVGEASNAAEALATARRVNPDVIIMDVRLPDDSGIEACRRIRAEMPHIKVLMLTSYPDDAAVFASIMAGASGYLLKQIEVEALCEALRTIGRGESILDPAVTNLVMERLKAASDGKKTPDENDLTPREREILELIADGLTNREIAIQTCLSEKTVRNYVSMILKKLDVSHRTQAAAYFLRHTKGYPGS